MVFTAPNSQYAHPLSVTLEPFFFYPTSAGHFLFLPPCFFVRAGFLEFFLVTPPFLFFPNPAPLRASCFSCHLSFAGIVQIPGIPRAGLVCFLRQRFGSVWVLLVLVRQPVLVSPFFPPFLLNPTPLFWVCFLSWSFHSSNLRVLPTSTCAAIVLFPPLSPFPHNDSFSFVHRPQESVFYCSFPILL